MTKKLLLRKVHRYVGLLVSIQLLAWAIGGIWFSWNDLDHIHGDHLKKNSIQAFEHTSIITPQQALEQISDILQLQYMNSAHILDRPIYKILYFDESGSSKVKIIDAINGQILPKISQDLAIKIAQHHAEFTAEVATAELLINTGKHHEYRSKQLPAWAISFDYKGHPTFYINQEDGQLVSVRHNDWRIFDFLWMLHTMDYQSRDDFGNWLIKIFSLIALITALSGIILFFISSRKPQTRR